VDRPDEFTLDGVAHIVGLTNSGKTTLADLITIHRVRDHGNWGLPGSQ
jgi:polynucleotide 5'-kinase involved in rRNA processing